MVVEDHEHGGSLITARAALERSIDVMAVPGSVHNRAAAGTNHLLRDGATPVTVRPTCWSRWSRPPPGRSIAVRPPALHRGVESAVLAVLSCRRATLDHVVVTMGLAMPTPRLRSPDSSARDGCATPADGSRRWCYGWPGGALD